MQSEGEDEVRGDAEERPAVVESRLGQKVEALS